MDLYAVNITDEIACETFNMLLNYISVERKQKIERFMLKKDKDRSLLSKVLIRYIICSKYNVFNEDICFKYNEYGKPFIHGCSNLDFNLSHSGNWVICGIDNKNIGVDIENIQRIDFENIAKCFFSNKEYEFILNSSQKDQMTNFYRIWTLKESYIKAVGKGLSIDLKSFTIDISNDSCIEFSSMKDLDGWNFKEYILDPDYRTSVCSWKGGFSDNIKIISQYELVEDFIRLVNF